MVGIDAQKPNPENRLQGELTISSKALLPDHGTIHKRAEKHLKLRKIPQQLRSLVSSSVNRKHHRTFLLRWLGALDGVLGRQRAGQGSCYCYHLGWEDAGFGVRADGSNLASGSNLAQVAGCSGPYYSTSVRVGIISKVGRITARLRAVVVRIN